MRLTVTDTVGLSPSSIFSQLTPQWLHWVTAFHVLWLDVLHYFKFHVETEKVGIRIIGLFWRLSTHSGCAGVWFLRRPCLRQILLMANTSMSSQGQRRDKIHTDLHPESSLSTYVTRSMLAYSIRVLHLLCKKPTVHDALYIWPLINPLATFLFTITASPLNNQAKIGKDVKIISFILNTHIGTILSILTEHISALDVGTLYVLSSANAGLKCTALKDHLKVVICISTSTPVHLVLISFGDPEEWAAMSLHAVFPRRGDMAMADGNQ